MSVEGGKALFATSTVAGMSTDVRERHLWKALSPIVVTDDGMVTEVREEQS